ncbi:nitrile hydratase beta subunit [Streptomyces puniciscabiei]|uniref:Nitrile hydratase beta subunit n=1 Tax=Streptomyces puniciscabiei TaxID=164348 RepID=A0A542U8Y8_9ACTN|nr:nitrile hydratase subunit alpha [Streptomyces puniciscabiei]TQK95537.1 nitrile hydratase beta subunit [Streptomyces puniciscabiei]
MLPDTNAHFLGENPQHVHTVRFDSRELWGADAERFALTVDMYESYLETTARPPPSAARTSFRGLAHRGTGAAAHRAGGLIDPQVMNGIIRQYGTNAGPLNGAKVVARAWTDPDYRRRLLQDGTAAINVFPGWLHTYWLTRAVRTGAVALH